MRLLLLALTLSAACGKNDAPPLPTSGAPNAPTESGPRAATSGVAGAAPAASPPPPPVVTGAAAEAQARQMFATVCAVCHGAAGKGDGQAAASLNPKPRDYTDPAWQASVTDDDIRKAIVLGGQGVGKSPMMPGNPQLKEQPAVLDALVKIIRGFAAPR